MWASEGRVCIPRCDVVRGQQGADLVNKAVLEALGFWDEFLGAAVAVPRGCGVADEIPVIHLKDDRLDQSCAAQDSNPLLSATMPNAARSQFRIIDYICCAVPASKSCQLLILASFHP